MKEQEESGFSRGFRAVLAAVLALALSLPVEGIASQRAYADEDDTQSGDTSGTVGSAAEASDARALGSDGDEIRIAVLSDTHYYPLNYVSDCEDYRTYVGGDPKMLEESGSILDAALQMVREDAPDILVVSGDLTKDGEKLGHEQLAERFQTIEDETDTEVFVINGNHDVFNYEDSCTFENGLKESAETTTADNFRQIYANFGYNGDYEAEYFTNPNHGAGEIAGELSYAVDLGNFTLVAVDSGRYSPDAGTGYDSNEHITAGRVDDDLLPWVVEKTREAEAEGDTVIGIMHHGLVPHFSMEDQILSEYVVDNWRDTATAFADAGMRYIFTGHMHANDISQFTSNAGNTITDLETGSLASWMSPVRSVTLTKGEALDDGTARTQESFSVSSESVKSISFKDHTGAVTQIDDFKSYTQQKLYPETLFNNMANGMLRPILQEIGEQGIRPWLAENLPEVDIDALILDAVPGLLEGGMDIELETGIGRVHVEYRNGGIQLQPSGTAGLIGDMTITDAQILRLVDDVLGKVEARYIDDPDWLLQQVDDIVTKVSNTGVDSLTAEEHTIYDLVFVCLTGHYAGCENPPSWVGDALAYIEQGDIITELIDGLLDDLMPVVDDILSNTSIDTGIAFSGLWKTAIDSVTDDGNLKATLETFGFGETEIRGLVESLINEYMSPSFLTGMGSLVSEIAGSMLYDSNFTDDAIDSGAPVTITFDGSATAPEPSVDNGLLPTQVTMTLGDDAWTERNFRWYTGTNVASGTVQVATDGSFAEGSIVAEVQAASEQVTKPKTQLNLGLVTTYGTQQAAKHSASVDGLQPGTTYWYRVGDKEAGYWSDVFQFVTGDAADTDESFTFINVNDSQGMVESDYDVYKNTLAQADGTFPGAAFTVHGGDFVDDGANEDYWTWALDDENGVAQGMSMTPAAGNHEAKSDVEGITDANPIVSHFNLANVPAGQDLSTGVYYSYVYKNATFVVLNTNDLAADESLSQAQYDWAYNTLAGADTEWKIVLMHKSPYSNGPHQSDSDVAAIRSQVDALAAACDVDLVLSGHDHVYNRTPFLMRGEEQDVDIETQTYKGANYETALNPNGTAFVIAGTCGVKNYAQTPSASIPSKVALDLSVPVYSGITIDGDHLYYQAYKVDGGSSSLVDSFAISKSEDDVPAWKQVEDMIASLPEQSDVTTADEAAITTARAAYDELSAEDKEKVSNYDRLVAAERMLALLQSVAGKRTVTASNDDDFYEALADSSVGTILTQGTIEFDEGGLFDDGTRELYVRHDVVVGGTGTLRYCRFHVESGATLVLKDSVYVNDTRSQGSFYDALNPVEVNAGGTLITQDSVSLRTEYGTGGSDEGVAVKLMGSGATAILGSNGTYWGSEAAVLSTVSGTTLVINDGTYNAKNNNRVVIDTHGDATVNGGTISSMWISGTLRVNGGTFEHQDSASSDWTPLAVSGGNAYITGGEFKTYGGRDGNASIKLEGGAKLHILASNNGNVKIGSTNAYVGSPSTDNYKDVKLGYTKANGWNASQDGVYRVDGAVSASSVEDIAALDALRMDTSDVSDNGNYMTTVLPDGTSTVFGKYWLYGDSSGKGAPSGSGIIGSGDVIVYGPVRTIQNNPVTGVTIDGETKRVIDLNQEGAGTLRLNGYTTPANAFDNGINWSSNNEQTASVTASAGQGVVTVKQAGGANITATSASNPSASATVEVIAVKPVLEGPDELDEETDEATFAAGKGFESDAYDSRLSFKYSVSDGTVASIDEETGLLTKLKAGNVKVVATLYLDGEPTGIAVEKDIVCKMKPEVSIDDVNALLDVQVTDANEAMASQHVAQTFEALIENSEGASGAYVIGEVYSEDEPAANVLEGAARLFGLERADKIWKADVTVQSAPYIAAFDKALQLPKGTHTVEGDASKTVTLVWSDGDPSANAAAGWTLTDPAATPMAFEAKCTSHTVSFAYVGAPSTVTVPDPAAVLSGSTYEPGKPAAIDHYEFEGWFTNQECTANYDPQKPVSGDITLYGKWVPDTFTVSFDADGDGLADDGIDSIEVAYGSAYGTLPEPDAVEGKSFQGWYLGESLVTEESIVAITEDAMLTAKWSDKAVIEITADEGNAKYVYDGSGHGFAFTKAPDDGIEGFTVEYCPAGSADDAAWTTDTPVNAGSYDVRVTRDEDGAYAKFEQVFAGGVVIAKADQKAPTTLYTAGWGSLKVTVQPYEGAYEWSADEDFKTGVADVADYGFTLNDSGTWYVRAKSDANHNAGAVKAVTIVKVTYDDNDGVEGADETENAVFSKPEGSAAPFYLMAAKQAVGNGNLPQVAWNGREFVKWAKPDGKEFKATTSVSEDITVKAEWKENVPAAPDSGDIAEIEGISVTLNGVNELNGDEGNKSHPDMTFAAAGENVQPLIAEGFTVGTVADEDGTWTVQVILDAQKYLDAYARMGTPAHGTHYFAKSTEDGKRSFELVYDKGTESWQLAEGEKPAYGFDITCLTLRPAAAEIYTGGTNENGGHFIDQYVVDGQGEVYAIDDLNALLDEGVTASVKYYDADGGEVEDDTVPGEYTARIDIEGTPQVRTGGEFDETVNVNVGGEAYAFALEPSQLVIRSVSDTDDAERGDFNVDLVDADDVDAVKAALDAAQGGVVAALNDGTTIYFNGNEDVPVADTSDITLFSDNLLPGQREGELIARANEKLGAGTVGEHYDFQYLDLVDQQQSNAWVSSSAGTKVFWKIPDGADPESVKVIHFKGLHRDYEADDEEVSGLIAASEVEAMELAEGTADDGYVSFTVPASGFSPYLMVWEEKGSQPTQQYTVTFDASPGALDAGYDSSVTVTAGGTIASLPTASRTGYEFGGWTANGAAFDSATPVNGNVTATAVWTPKQYEVTLDAQGGTFSNGGDSLAVQATYDATLPAFEQPQRAGWSFEGWFTETTGGTEVAAGSLYQTAGASTYYAHWAPVAAEQVDVTFDAGKGSFDGGASTATVKVPKGGTLSEGDLPEASRAGFALEGWYLDEQLSQKVVLAEEADPSLGIAATVFDGATTLHAKWLEDISEDADISFAGISQPYTGAAVSAVPTFGDGFPESEQGEVQVFYRSGDEPWSSGAPVSVGSYDVRFVYEGSDAYAPFEKEYPAGVVVTPAKLAQTGLSANPAEVPAGTKLADIALVGGAVTRADGTQVAGTWSWIDAAGAVDAAGTYRAVFTPADGAANYQPLYADVQVGVKASEPGTDPSDPDKPGTDPGDPGTNPGGSGDGNQGGSGSDPGQGGSSSGNQSGGSDQGSDPGQGGSSGSDQGSGSKGLAGAGDPLAGMLAGLGAVLAAAFAACVIALRRSRR